MSFFRYAILVMLLVVLGLITVWEHLRLLSVGYDVSDLRGRRVRLEEEVRVQERRIDAIATPGETAGRVKSLGIDLAPRRAPRDLPRREAAGPPGGER